MTTKRFFIVTAVVLSIIIGILGGYIYWILSDLPGIKAIEEYAPAESSIVYADDGSVLAELYAERRTFVPSYQIPQRVKLAVVAIEDARFYHHPGVDIIGILRALYHDIKAGEIVQGGSTITQQLAKMLFLTPEKSIARKIKEAAISIQLEKRYTKDEILGLYLNQAYFGAGAYGIEAASQVYFGKSCKDIDIAEAALLAGLVRAPTAFSPFKDPSKALLRREVVLRKMYELGHITKAQLTAAENEPLPEHFNKRPFNAPYFIEYLKQHLEARYGDALYKGGLRIYSTINPEMQDAAEKAVTEGVRAIEKRVRPGIQGALLCIEPATGQIKAMVGGKDFWKSQFNRATQALRQPGSAFKPFVYVTALMHGYSPTDTINDSPVSYPGAVKGRPWIPKNYDGRYRGPITLRDALAYSVNVCAVKLLASLGVDPVIESAHRLGVRSPLQPYLPLALGASDLTLMELTSSYAVFADNGIRVEPIAYTRIKNRDGITIEDVRPTTTDVLDPDTAHMMTYMLRAVVEEGTAVRAKELKRPIAGKTGTTNDFRDAWFIGFTPRLITGVWVGRDNHKPIGPRETGARAALPIWMNFMEQVLKDKPVEDFAEPDLDKIKHASTGPNTPQTVDEIDSILEKVVSPKDTP